MATRTHPSSRLDTKRREQTPQALARLAIVGLFIGLWLMLWLGRIPMPVPFLVVLLVETLFFLVYWRTVFLLPSVRAVELAQYGMLGAEIVFHTTMVYFLGGVSWLGAFAYVFGLIFANTFLDLRRGFLYTGGASLAFAALVLLEATGTIPHYVYLEQGPLRYSDPRLVATTVIAGFGVFFSIYCWVNWVGRQLRRERDAAVRAQDGLLRARAELQRANEELEERVSERTAELELANAALRESEQRLRTVISNAPIVLFALDNEGVYTLLEGKGLERLRVQQDEVVGRSVFDVFRDAPEALARVRRALAGEAVTTVTETAGFLFESQLVPIRDDGKVVGVIGVATDITERKRAEEALRESEERHRSLLDNYIGGVALVVDGKIAYANPCLAEMMGHTAEDLQGRSPLDLVAPVDRQRAAERLSALLTGAPEQTSEYRMLRKDGSLLPVEAASRLIQLAGKAAVLAVVHDVTERKQAEQALRESEERFRKVFAEGPLGMAIVTPDYRLANVNKSLCEMVGYSDQELTAMTFPDITHPEDVDKDVQLAQQVFGGEIPFYEIEKRYITKSGDTIWINLHASVIRGPDGTPLYGLAMIEDITERKQAEEALRESEERYRELFENANDIVYTHDLTGRFTSINRVAEQVTGYTRDEALKENIATVVAPEYLEMAKEMILRKLRGEPSTVYELEIITKAGRRVPVEVSTRVTYEDGKPVGVQGIVRDITERKRAEEALRASESKFRTLAETVAAAAFIFQGTKMRYVNSAAEAMTGYAREELLDMNFWDVIHPDFQELVRERGQGRQRGEKVPSGYEVKVLTKGGEERWVDFTAGVIEFEGSPAILGTAFDITERKRAEEALRERARRDPLTGVLNHAAIVDELRSLTVGGGDGALSAVAMVDVNDLKVTNDTYGHQMGDDVLVTVAQTLSRDDAVVGRYGGDEFVVILRGADRPAAERHRDAVLSKLADARLIDRETGTNVPVLASIGLAIYPEEADTVHELIGLADSAMYASRRQRPTGSTGKTLSEPLGDDRAANMVGELVPLLTSPGDLDDKLRLVAHRLSIGAGYDAVNFELLAHRPGGLSAASTFAPGLNEEVWTRYERREGPGSLRPILERARRPIILDDPQRDGRLRETEQKLMRAAGLRSVLVAPMLWQDQLVGMLSVASKRERAFTSRDAQFLAAVATQVTAIVRMATLVDELQASSTRREQAQEEAILLLAAAAEAHDQTTGLHLQDVRALTEALARELGYREEEARELGLAAVLHDIGKIRVSDSILASTGELTGDAWELMKRHTVWGAELLAGRPGFEVAAAIARSHHERWDGSGYPDGLSGEAIPETAAIVTVTDAFDAMTSERPYRKRRSVQQAVREIVAYSGQQFSPAVVDALLQLHQRKLLPRPSQRSSRRAA